MTTKKGILQFYLKRFLKVCVPAWIILFFLFSVGFTKPMLQDKKTVFQLFTFCYYGGLDGVGVGAFWYLSVLLKYYLIAPFTYFFVKKLRAVDKKAGFILFNLMALLGFSYRFIIYGMNLDYYIHISISLLGNLDFFVCGILLNSITNSKNGVLNKQSRIFRNIYLGVIVLAGCFINYKYYELEFLRKYICPTIAIYVIAIYIVLCDKKAVSKPSFLGFLTKEFAKIGLPFFLLHSVILVNISSVLKSRGYLFHVEFFMITFIVTVILSFCFEDMKIFQHLRLSLDSRRG